MGGNRCRKRKNQRLGVEPFFGGAASAFVRFTETEKAPQGEATHLFHFFVFWGGPVKRDTPFWIAGRIRLAYLKGRWGT